jgi:UDP-N-acetylglucosamine 2-epimerase (non-hydrolysing)
MTGLKANEVINGLEEVIANPPAADRVLPQGYEVTDFSQRVVRFIMSTYGRHHEWAGIRKLG